jgi:hypothetical protein
MFIIHIKIEILYNCDIFTFKVTNAQNVHHQQQGIVDNKVQQTDRRSILLLMEQRHMQFQFQTSGLAMYVVLRCKQHSIEHPIGNSLMVLGRVILVDTPHFPFVLSIFQENEHPADFSHRYGNAVAQRLV